MCNSQSILNPRKRDWLLMYKKEELTKLMRDNGKIERYHNIYLYKWCNSPSSIRFEQNKAHL